MRYKIMLALLFAMLVVGTYASASRIASPDKVTSSTIGGCQVLPTDNIWNTQVINAPAHANSNAYVNTIGANTGMHADFGSGTWDGGPIGIPFVTVNGNTQPMVAIHYQAYGNESDPGPFPVPTNAPIEGGPSANGDRHVLVLDNVNCMLYELYRAFPNANGSWNADSGAKYDLSSNALRPYGWTSADAAGLPILPGLFTYDEVQAAIAGDGMLHHAIRFTVPQTRSSFVWPARHEASNLTGTQYPPMGQRFRLKMTEATISTYSPEAQVILRTLKYYGMILADNGSAIYISGAPDPRWDNDVLHEIDNVTMSDFEAVYVGYMQVANNSGQANPNNPIPLPPPPTLTTPAHRAHITNRRPTFGWQAVPQTMGYRISIYTENRAFLLKARVTTTSFTPASNLPIAKLLWRVRSQDVNTGMYGVFSGRFTVFIEAPAFNEPTPLPPTLEPTATETAVPPTDVPTEVPTDTPTDLPTEKPTDIPTEVPTDIPTEVPTDVPTDVPNDDEVPSETPLP